MKYLIDTQVLIWSLVNPAKLSVRACEVLQTDTIYVSVLSLFEIVIKQKIGKLPQLPVTTNVLAGQIRSDGFELTPITIRHIAMYDLIPLHHDHRDPFDRLILATALAEEMPLISADGNFSRYKDIVEIIW